MRKSTKVLIATMVTVLCCLCLFTGCKNSKQDSPETTGVRFGEFGYNGIYLTSFSSQTIEAENAKSILARNMNGFATNYATTASFGTEADATPPEALVNHILLKYSQCTIVTKYYVEGDNSDEKYTKVTKTDLLQGTDLKSIVERNEFAPFSQLVAKYLVCFPDLIDTMEQLNTEFRNSPNGMIAPFKNMFTYHTDSKGQLVIQTSDFAEIPASVGGGITSSYRQDNEILYDADNKIQKWQTSLGLYTATPNGTMKQGYILEMEFNWTLK